MERGFSLLELLTTILIVGILASLGFYSYYDCITRTRRLDGKMALLALANRMERYFSEKNTYEAATIGTSTATDVQGSTTSEGGWYTLRIIQQTSTDFAIEASPCGQQAIDDKFCQTLTLNSFGVKGVGPGIAGAPQWTAKACW